MKYRRRSTTVEAVRWEGDNQYEIRQFVFMGLGPTLGTSYVTRTLVIPFKGKLLEVAIGDYIVREITGEIEIYKPDIFYALFEEIKS